MRPRKMEVISASGSEVTEAPGQRRRLVVAHRVEEILGEVAPTLRRLRMFLLVATISLPLSIVVFGAVLWHLAR
jgi:hypothetical protein